MAAYTFSVSHIGFVTMNLLYESRLIETRSFFSRVFITTAMTNKYHNSGAIVPKGLK